MEEFSVVVVVPEAPIVYPEAVTEKFDAVVVNVPAKFLISPVMVKALPALKFLRYSCLWPLA